MMVVAHNLLAMNGDRMLGINSKKKASITEKLSSGYRINRSADDAAGLAISEKMRRQVRGLTQASQNIQDGVSFCQVADGYLNEVHDILHRITELAVKSENGTNSPEDRSYMDSEVQELKKELNRIFKTAEFNEIPIWDEPYMPEPALDPFREPDIQVYNETVAGGIPVCGGVEINDVRHTWEELGIAVENGRFSANQEVEFEDYTGERVYLKVKKGDDLSSVTRNYKWRAEDDGIYVNNKLAATWDSIEGLKATNNAKGSYEFSYKNFDISFTVKEGDSLEDIKQGINGKVLDTYYTWDMSSPNVTIRNQAVDMTSKQTVKVSQLNKDIINLDYWVHADESGVTLVDSEAHDHTITPWGNFSNTCSDNATTDDPYPIVDWGTSRIDGKGKDSDYITFDDEAEYEYTDTVPNGLSLNFTFKLGDEASRDAVIAGLNGVPFTGEVSAPGRFTTHTYFESAQNKSSISIKTDNLNTNNALKQAYGMDPSDSSSVITGNIVRSFHIADETDDEGNKQGYFTYSGNFGGESMETVQGKLFKIPADPDDYTMTDEIKVKTASGEPLVLKCKNDLLNLTEMQNAITYKADGSVSTVVTSNDQSSASWISVNGVDGRGMLQLQIDYGRDFNVQYDALEGELTRKFVLEDSGTTGHFEYNGSFNGVSLNAVTGQSFHVPVSDANAVLEENVRLTSATGCDIMTVAFENDLRNLSDVGSSFRLNTTDYAYRTFEADEYLANNVNSKTIYTDIKLNLPKRELTIQAGAEAKQGITMRWDVLSNALLGIAGTTVKTPETAGIANMQIKNAMKVVSAERADFGAYQNRFEHAKMVDDNVVENTTAAESRIRDSDMAREMVELSRQNILEQVSQSMLSQANQTPQGVLSLLQ